MLKQEGFVNTTQAESILGLEDREQQDTIVLYAKSSHIHVVSTEIQALETDSFSAIKISAVFSSPL